MVDLSVKIGKLKLKNPVIVASGTFGPEYRHLIDVAKLGAIITKTITVNKRIGNPPPRVEETASGMLNSIGLENDGLDDFINKKIPVFPQDKTALIVSIAGDTEEDFRKLASTLNDAPKIGAIELNLSCPNVKHGDRSGLIAQDAEATYEIVKAAREETGLTIIAKLSPNITDIKEIAKAAESAGADSISLVNTFLGMAVDIETKRPKLGNVTGGLSGPAIKPLALKLVRDAYNAVKIPVIGMGGIMDYKDAVEFMLCGAAAVQIGTANFVDPNITSAVIDGIKDYLAKNRLNSVNDITGKLQT